MLLSSGGRCDWECRGRGAGEVDSNAEVRALAFWPGLGRPEWRRIMAGSRRETALQEKGCGPGPYWKMAETQSRRRMPTYGREQRRGAGRAALQANMCQAECRQKGEGSGRSTGPITLVGGQACRAGTTAILPGGRVVVVGGG